LWKGAPADVSAFHIEDEDTLGVALGVSEYKDVVIEESMSTPIYTAFRVSKLSANSIKWVPPVYFDKHAEFQDIQIID
jgi:hypothetical protein